MNKYIEGYATVFNQWYRAFNKRNKEWYFEKILPDAIDQKFIDSQLVMARLMHEERYIIATNFIGKETLTRQVNGKLEKYESGIIGDGQLNLKVDNNGLYYSIKVDENNNLHKACVRFIESGYLEGSSMAIVSDEQNKENSKTEIIKGVKYKTIYKIDFLTDVAPVTRGQNPHCTVQVKEHKEHLNLRQVNNYDEQLKKFIDYDFDCYYKKLCKENLPRLSK